VGDGDGQSHWHPRKNMVLIVAAAVGRGGGGWNLGAQPLVVVGGGDSAPVLSIGTPSVTVGKP